MVVGPARGIVFDETGKELSKTRCWWERLRLPNQNEGQAKASPSHRSTVL